MAGLPDQGRHAARPRSGGATCSCALKYRRGWPRVGARSHSPPGPKSCTPGALPPAAGRGIGPGKSMRRAIACITWSFLPGHRRGRHRAHSWHERPSGGSMAAWSAVRQLPRRARAPSGAACSVRCWRTTWCVSRLASRYRSCGRSCSDSLFRHLTSRVVRSSLALASARNWPSARDASTRWHPSAHGPAARAPSDGTSRHAENTSSPKNRRKRPPVATIPRRTATMTAW